MGRSIAEINERIERKDAVVLTAQEVCDIVKSGEGLTELISKPSI